MERLQVFVRGLFEQAERHALLCELVLVEWNPPSDKCKLRNAIKWPEGNRFCRGRIIEVSPAIHSRYKCSTSLPLYQMIAKNVGIQRAVGDFVAATNVDVLFSDELFQFFKSSRLRQGEIYRVDRYDVDRSLPVWEPLENQLRFCAENIVRVHSRFGTLVLGDGSYFPIYVNPALVNDDEVAYIAKSPDWPSCADRSSIELPELHTNACGDFQLMARSHWQELKGYIELDAYSFHVDSLLGYAAYSAGLKEVCLGDPLRLYHVDHDGGFIAEASMKLEQILETRQLPRLSNEELYRMARRIVHERTPTCFGQELWGLSDLSLPEENVCNTEGAQVI